MKRNMRGRGDSDPRDFFGLMICAIFFVCGIIVGSFSARHLDAVGTQALYERMLGYMEQIRSGTYVSPGLLSVLWTTGRDHLLVLFLGFSLLGALCLPILSGVRGFYLSFSIAAFIRVFGPDGVPVALSLFGVGALLTLPAFFILATQAFSASAQMAKAVFGTGSLQVGLLYGREYLFRLIVCFMGILAAVFIERYLTPALVSWTSSFI